jgi:hypothetical protein
MLLVHLVKEFLLVVLHHVELIYHIFHFLLDFFLDHGVVFLDIDVEVFFEFVDLLLHLLAELQLIFDILEQLVSLWLFVSAAFLLRHEG